jgi:hypothetical protein
MYALNNRTSNLSTFIVAMIGVAAFLDVIDEGGKQAGGGEIVNETVDASLIKEHKNHNNV